MRIDKSTADKAADLLRSEPGITMQRFLTAIGTHTRNEGVLATLSYMIPIYEDDTRPVTLYLDESLPFSAGSNLEAHR